MPLSTLSGRDVIVVGGAGGIGSAVTELLASEGARVTSTYRSRPREGAIQVDITNPEDRRRLLDGVPGLYGLVVMAGDPARAADASQVEDAMRRSHENNYLGPVMLAREAVERMKAAGTPGAVVLMSTMQAVALFPGSTTYAGAKAALAHAARILAKECRGPADIRVNVVSPGVTQAGMAEASIASGKYDRFLNDGVVPRFGRAIDVARAVRFFLEPDSYVTGQVLSVDGGLTL